MATKKTDKDVLDMKKTVVKPTLAKSKDAPLIEVIWPAKFGVGHRRGGYDFAPGEVLCFKSRSDIPTSILTDKGFIIREAFYSHNRSDARLRPPLLPLPEGAEEKLGLNDDEETPEEEAKKPVKVEPEVEPEAEAPADENTDDE